MSRKILSRKAKKVVRWHDNYVVFVTPEVKQANLERENHREGFPDRRRRREKDTYREGHGALVLIF